MNHTDNLDTLIEKVSSNLENKHQELIAVKEEWKDALEQQVVCFSEIAVKIEPIIKFLKENNYWFSHPDDKLITTFGAVLGVTDESVYCFTYGDIVTKHNKWDFNIYENILVSMALTEIKLDVAIKGLLNVLKIQENTFKKCNEEKQTLILDLKEVQQIYNFLK